MRNAMLPESDIDLFSDDNLRHPWDHYRALRDQGPAVMLTRQNAVVLPRYHELRAALLDDKLFSSASGVALNDAANQQMRGTVIASDGADHARLRGVLRESLSPRALVQLGDEVQRRADEIVASLPAGQPIEAVEAISRRLPLTIVLDLIGVDDFGRQHTLEWADNSFNLFGPITSPRTVKALESMQEVFVYAFEVTAQAGRLRPGSMGAAIVEAVRDGKIGPQEAPGLLVAYLTGGLDTTIASISHMLHLFAQHPDQWTMLRAKPDLIPAAYQEVLRLRSPAHWFTRFTTQDVDVGGTVLPAGTRTVMLFASANRDERKWDHPDEFDILRDAADQLAFGYGRHACAGQGLARLEVISLMNALTRRFARIEAGGSALAVNNLIHGYARLEVVLA
jgi:cytochrome P450